MLKTPDAETQAVLDLMDAKIATLDPQSDECRVWTYARGSIWQLAVNETLSREHKNLIDENLAALAKMSGGV